MANQQDKILLLYGGRSGEHEVSMVSASYIYHTLRAANYQLFPVWLNHSGEWFYLTPEEARTLNSDAPLPAARQPCRLSSSGGQVQLEADNGEKHTVDFAFNLLHGSYGEDGRMQGFLETLGLPSSGSGVAGSAVALDKIFTKNILAACGVPQVNYSELRRHDYQLRQKESIRKIENLFDYPLFVKPANLGSSVGVAKCYNREELNQGIATALEFDHRLIIEEAKKIREVEFGVVGNGEDIKISEPGEIVHTFDFYNYEAKYKTTDSLQLVIPAKIPEKIKEHSIEIIKQAWQALGCDGYGRADLFYEEESEQIYFNEINTIPGFTRLSMFPLLWRESGLGDSALLEEIIRLGHERAKKNGELLSFYKDALTIKQ